MNINNKDRPMGRLLAPHKNGDAGAGVRNWASILDENAREQALATARTPVMAGPVALMPDAHLGRGATVGSVIVTRDAIIPAAVGVDIGCGMIAALTDRAAEDLVDPQRVLRGIRKSIPAGFSWHRKALPAAEEWFEENPVPHMERDFNRAKRQLRTLGGGNHFVEVSVDEKGRLWVVLHTGSRGIGNNIAMIHIKESARVCEQAGRRAEKELSYYEAGDDSFGAYIDQMLWAQSYAWRNRELMLEAVLASLREDMGEVELVDVINCHHNYAAEETHNGETVWVTRKGAIRAGKEDRGVIPGSMGTDSYIVRGLGNPLSYESAAHGAGRVMSRTKAKKTFTPEQLAEAMSGKAWESHNARRLVDEAPWSYKPIEQVMADQENLVVAENRLASLVNYKGA